jgi:hypothetical protein
MNSPLFYTEVWVPKLGTSCTSCFKSTYELLSFQHWFVGLDENTIDHDYLYSKIAPRDSRMEF